MSDHVRLIFDDEEPIKEYVIYGNTSNTPVNSGFSQNSSSKAIVRDKYNILTAIWIFKHSIGIGYFRKLINTSLFV